MEAQTGTRNNLKKGIVALDLIIELCTHENVAGRRRRPVRGNNLKNKVIVARNLFREMCAHKNFARWRRRPVRGTIWKKGIVAWDLIIELCTHENVAGRRRRPVRGNNLKNKGIVAGNLILEPCTHEMLRNLRGINWRFSFRERGHRSRRRPIFEMAIKGRVARDLLFELGTHGISHRGRDWPTINIV